MTHGTPHRRPSSHARFARAMIGCVLVAACSRADRSAIRAPEYEGGLVATPTGPLRLIMSPDRQVVRNRDVILVRYSLQNAGPVAQRFRDVPGFYFFNLLDPDGHRQLPVANSEVMGSGGVNTVLLEPGESGEEHVINLACMEYHPLTFTPQFRNTTPYGCMLQYRLHKAGTYTVIGQRIPPGPMPEYGVKGELPSTADTVRFEYRPWWRLWH